MAQASTRRSAIAGFVIGAVIGKVVLPPPANDNLPSRSPPPSSGSVKPGAHTISPNTKLSSLNEVERERLLDAMQRQEGWRPGTTSYRGNNPGNINQGKWARAHGSIGNIHGIAIFSDYKTGRDAMRALIFGVYGDRTIYGMLAGDPAHGIKGYAPAVVDQFGNKGRPDLYAQNVATWMNEMAAQHSDAAHSDKMSATHVVRSQPRDPPPHASYPPGGSAPEHDPGDVRSRWRQVG